MYIYIYIHTDVKSKLDICSEMIICIVKIALACFYLCCDEFSYCLTMPISWFL